MGSKGPKRISTQTEGQENVLNQLLESLGQGLPTGLESILTQLDPEKTAALFEQGVAAPAQERFKSQTIPSILQASTNLGAKGGGSIERQLGQAGRGLEGDLAAQLAQFQAGQQQAGIGNLSQLLGIGLGKEAFAIQPGQPGIGQQILGGAFGLAGQLGGAHLGRKR